jgi:hypothetical protein
MDTVTIVANTTVPVWVNPRPDDIVILGNVNVQTEDTCGAQFRFRKPNILPVIFFCISMSLLALLVISFIVVGLIKLYIIRNSAE